jgi:hypothetical protein
MTKKKEISKSIKNLIEDPEITRLLDRSDSSDDLYEKMIQSWGYDLYSRKPGPAYIEGNYVGTDLDLACFIYELAQRNAVINFPLGYKAMGPRTITEGEQIISKENRHGPIIKLTSNKDFWKFGVTINDYNIITTESVGEPRSFLLTGLNGDFYPGWHKINFMPTAKENYFLNEHNLWTFTNQLIFKTFEHPNRWPSFFGKYYFQSKIMLKKIKEHRQHLNKEKKRIMNAGVEMPTKDESKYQYKAPQSKKRKKVGKSKKIKAPCFNVELDFIPFENEFKTYLETEQELMTIDSYYKKLGQYAQRLQFMTRVTELSHWKNKDKFPAWMKNLSWEKDYVQKGKRIKWERLVLFQPTVGELGVSYRRREYQKSVEVSEDYQE